MTTSSPGDGFNAVPGDHQIQPAEAAKLKAGAVGLVGVLFMALANAAPITAMTFNVPIAVGYGNGTGAPAGYLFAMIVLSIFTVGFVSMARYITTAGAFYGFISHGLGQVTGMASGLLAAVAYIIFEASLIGGFSYFASTYVLEPMGVHLHWMVIATIGILVIAALTYFSVTLAAGVLGVTLVCEIILLVTLGVSVLLHPGPDGFLKESLSIPYAFEGLKANEYGSGAAAGVGAIGLFFAFWSWVGYETTAVYGEESSNPKRNVPMATMFAVIGLGLFYTFMSLMAIVGNGAAKSIQLSAGASPIDLWIGLVQGNLGGFAVGAYKFLVVMGSFACAMAFHNAAARYIFAMARETPWAGVRNTIGGVNAKHGSPAMASFLQSGITFLLCLFFLFTTSLPKEAGGNAAVPYVYVYGLLALVGTAMILIVQTLTSAAVVNYFWGKKVHRGHWLTTLVAPILGGLGMLFALYLLWSNKEFAAGLASNSIVYTLMPYYTVGLFVAGVVYAYYVKSKHPATYDMIGRTVLEEAHER